MTESGPSGQQRLASDPAASAWVGANAGSGKTRVLTQRVARLLLAGADPGKILCLTYTKAAAAEMQSRLFALLGDWSMQPDDALDVMLRSLDGTTAKVPPETLARARRLFARALETPGGLKIQTIHAFCDALLRRFPLEAGVSPNFDVIDDRQSALLLAEIRDQMARASEAGGDPAFDKLASRLNEDAIDAIILDVLSRRSGFRDEVIASKIVDVFGAGSLGDLDQCLKAALEMHLDTLRSVAPTLATGLQSDQNAADGLSAAVKLAQSHPARAAEALAEALLVKSGPRAGKIRARLPTKNLRHANPGLAGQVEDLADLAIRLRETVLAHAAAARTTDLHVFARSLLKRYAAAKDARALLDFEDLVSRTRDLLSASDLRAWVLYKLDSGLDHVLVDEAQDTSPQQWEVISAITDDFHSGGRDFGAGPGLNRSIFVVGDEKQSIYSFQGAEPTAFGSMRTRLADRLEAIGDELRRPALITSFRSAPQILDFVDAVFAGPEADGVTYTGDAIRHEAYRSGDPGRIDLWPLVEKRDDPDEGAWWEPVDRPPRDDPRIRLADALALEIRRMIAEDWLPDRAGQPRRRVSPGSILVLVRRRDRLARRLIDALKARDVPVSGSDRLSLAEELAVRDILALIRAVLAPADDLSLAAALRSPLGSISEEDLFDLAHDRAGSLRAALSERRDRFERDADMIDDLALKAGFLGPYEYLERILIHHDGRRRLLARLGPEAEDCIDELLAQALAFESRETPTLIGFVAWIEAGDVTLKREMEKGTDEVRVMTIHGAKGLEAPVVILPDTVGRAAGGARPVLLPNDPGAEDTLIIWAGPSASDDPATMAARAMAKAREEAEAKRLLYVGLTRAEDWLILCGAGNRQDADKSWYGRLEAAAVTFGGQPETAPEGLDGFITRICPAVPEAGSAGPSGAAQDRDEPVRDPWISRAPREARLRRIAPSSLAPKVGRSAYGDLEDPEQARLRGLAVHALLERLPEIPVGDRETQVDQILADFIPHLPDELITEVRIEANAVLNERSFADLFGPESLGETLVTIPISEPGFVPMQGRIDRLLVQPGRVLIVDFKTDQHAARTMDETPLSYRAQLGAYLSAIKAIYPDRLVEAGLLWTRTRELLVFPGPDLEDTYTEALASATGIDLASAHT